MRRDKMSRCACCAELILLALCIVLHLPAQDAQQEIRDLATAPDTPTKSPKKRRRPRTPGSKENLSDVKPKKLFDDSARKDRPTGSSFKKQEPEMEPANHDAGDALEEAATDTDNEDADIFSGEFAAPKKGKPGSNSVQTQESQQHPAPLLPHCRPLPQNPMLQFLRSRRMFWTLSTPPCLPS